MLNKWNRLPVAVRWILLIPIELVVITIIGFISRVHLLLVGLPAQAAEVVFLTLMALVSVFIIYHLAPKGKFSLLIVIISLRSLIIFVFIFGAVCMCMSIDTEVIWGEWWR